MTKFTTTLWQIGEYKDHLKSQVERMNEKILLFVDTELHDVKEARNCFDKADLHHDQARGKFLSPRKGDTTASEKDLHNARYSFEEARFKLVNILMDVKGKKRFEILEDVCGTMDAHLQYFKQGHELFLDMEPYLKKVLTYAQGKREGFICEEDDLNAMMDKYKNDVALSANVDGDSVVGRSPYKRIAAVMQSTAAKGKVQTIRQGYLLKQSTNIRGDWKRRFFVLDSRGSLCYYHNPSGSVSQHFGQSNSCEIGSGLLTRWISSDNHGGIHDEKSVAHNTVSLLTSTVKADDQSDVRFCFRVISPERTYTLQANSALDQKDWIENISGVIESLVSSQTSEGVLHKNSDGPGQKSEELIDILRGVCGNDKCADCGATEPEWASLNLGILVCIECSGIHRSLGVEISKVRSLTLDVKAWEPSVLKLFQSLGNDFPNSVWEELLQSSGPTGTGSNVAKPDVLSFPKPCHEDSMITKENFIRAKYANRMFLGKLKDNQPVQEQIWEAVQSNDNKAVYRVIVNSEANVNFSYERVNSISQGIKDVDKCSLLHLSCQSGDIGMLELLLQHGAKINASDARRQTPLHHSIDGGNIELAKFLITRGADPKAVDDHGRTPLDLAKDKGFDF